MGKNGDANKIAVSTFFIKEDDYNLYEEMTTEEILEDLESKGLKIKNALNLLLSGTNA